MKRKLLLIVLFVMVLMAISAPLVSAAEPSTSNGYWYRVHYGDTLYSISLYTGVSVATLTQVNGIQNPNYIYAGQSLWIPTMSQPSYYHTVKYGETLSSIGRMYGVSPWAIAQANNIYNMNYIYAGQLLVIP